MSCLVSILHVTIINLAFSVSVHVCVYVCLCLCDDMLRDFELFLFRRLTGFLLRQLISPISNL